MWTWQMGVEWVVAGVVKTCSDGALDERNMKGFILFVLEAHACFCTPLSYMQS